MGQSGPIGDGRIDIVDVGNVDLAVVAHDGAGHVAAADLELRVCNAGADAFRAFAKADGFGPAITLGDMDGGARRVEQAGTGFGDLVQRAFGIARGAGDGAQNFGTG